MNLGRYADAARHMRVRQLAYRTRRAVPPRLLAAGLRSADPPAWRPLASRLFVDRAPQFGPGHTVFPGDWNDDELLVRFHRHGFRELAADPGPHWEPVIDDWLDRYGETPDNVAWHPFPLSDRVLSWCAALCARKWPSGDAMRRSLWRQLRVLRRSVEHDIGGNHVLHNGAALVTGGACLGDDSALRQGLQLLEAELALQIDADGGHEERSPSYQRAILSDLQDTAEVLRRAGRPVPFGPVLDRMDAWLHALAGPDGSLPVFNDGWDGPRVEPAQDAVRDLAGSGYVVLRDGDDQAVLDLAPVAPPHLPAHAHADVLSFVLWAAGRPVVIDPGSGAYAGPDRAAFRGTAAHATVEIDGRDQCDLWAPFRAAHMPRVVERRIERRADGQVVVHGAHDGYRPAIHHRTFLWEPGRGLTIEDRLESPGAHTIVSRLPFAEGLDPRGELPGGLRLQAIASDFTVVPGRRAPYLGTTVPILVAELRRRVEPGERFGWRLVR